MPKLRTIENMKTPPEVLRRNLVSARRAVRNAPQGRFRYHHVTNPTRNNPYEWCKAGWEANNYEGYFYDIPNTLRQHVEGGDLTLWWQQGRSRREVTKLFNKAIAGLFPHPGPKLNLEVAREVRARLADGVLPKWVAAEFGISEATVSRIRTGKIWRESA